MPLSLVDRAGVFTHDVGLPAATVSVHDASQCRHR